MKQTAVEWLVEQVFGKHTYVWNDVIEKAKQKEREQIKDAWLDGISNWDSEKEVEQYYNETYKGGEQ